LPPPPSLKTQRSRSIDATGDTTLKLPVRPPVPEPQQNGGFSFPPRPPATNSVPPSVLAAGRRHSLADERVKPLPPTPPFSSGGTPGKSPPPPPPGKKTAQPPPPPPPVNGDASPRRFSSTPAFHLPPVPAAVPSSAVQSLRSVMPKTNGNHSPAASTGGHQFRPPTPVPRPAFTPFTPPDNRQSNVIRNSPPPPPPSSSKYNGPSSPPRATPPPAPPPMHRPPSQPRPGNSSGPPPALPPSRSAPAAIASQPPVPPASRFPHKGTPPVLPPARGSRPSSGAPTLPPQRQPNGPPPPLPPPRMTSNFR